jgi:glycosyltransferase involved in cell wall biosynthesis
MHIAFVSTQFISITLTGGLGNHLLRVGLSLVETGHRPTILMIADQEKEEMYRGIRLIHVRGKPASIMKRLRRGAIHSNAYQSKCFRTAIAKLNERDPIDIIQYTNYRGTALYRYKPVPSVMRVSSYRPLWDKLHPTAEERWSRKTAAVIEMRSMQNVDAIYAPSKILSTVLSEQIGRTVDVVEPPFLLDQEEWDDSLRQSIVGDYPYFLFVGSLTKRKGAFVIAESIDELCRRFPNHQFVFIGKTEFHDGVSTIDIMRTRVSDRGRIIYHPPIPHSQLYPFYTSADVVLMPSLVDNLPNTCLEAMALGAIVVGTRGASFDQLIDDNVSGFLAETGDALSFIDAVERAIRLPGGARKSVSDRARERIAQLAPKYTIPHLIQYYLGVISEKNAT